MPYLGWEVAESEATALELKVKLQPVYTAALV